MNNNNNMKNKPENEIWKDKFIGMSLVFLIPIIVLGLLIRFFEFPQIIQSIIEVTLIVFLVLFMLSVAAWKWLRLSWGGGKEFKKFLRWSIVGAIGIIFVASSIAWYAFKSSQEDKGNCFGTADIVRMCNPETGEEKLVPSVSNSTNGDGVCLDVQKLEAEGWQKCQ